MDKSKNDQIVHALERIETLLKHIVAVQLYQAGVNQQLIAKHLKTATASVGVLLKGVEKGIKNNEKPKPENS